MIPHARRLRGRGRILILVLLAGSATGGAAWQTPPPQPPTFRTGANLVLTDVFVTRDGEPVTDLTAAEVRIHEDGVPQTIRSFEQVRIATGATSPPAARAPSTVAASRELAADPRRRAFVLFLDTYHVTPEASASVSSSLLHFLDRILGPDDVLAVMTPAMRPGDVVFSPQTGALRDWLAAKPKWGMRDEWIFTPVHEEEERLQACTRWLDQHNFRDLLRRWREKRALAALAELVTHLDGMRDGRKSVLVVSEGWELYRSSERLELVPNGRVPGPGAVGVGPDGTLGIGDRRGFGGTPNEVCDALRQRIAQDETRLLFRNDVIGEANRANVSFYTIDPRGLPVFDLDTSVPGFQPLKDADALRSRIDTLRSLAEATDGLAIVNTRAHREGLRRIAGDLMSYYLIGYQSTNSATDGTFRKVRITVARPGVQVRAREGYRAAPPGSAAGSGAVSAAPATLSPAETAIGSLVELRHDLPVLLTADASGTAGGNGSRLVRMVAELGQGAARDAAWARGGTAQFTVKAPDGSTVATVEAAMAAGDASVAAEVGAALAADAAGYRVQVRLQPTTASGPAAALSNSAPVRAWPSSVPFGAPQLWRRGPSTGLRYVATADVRFRRQERLRMDLPASLPSTAVSARVTDRRGTALPIPVSVGPAPADGRLLVDVSLAPLAPGDYALVVEAGGAASPAMAIAFRVVP